jgi:YidC/Oxa1 family membrane protein insertase
MPPENQSGGKFTIYIGPMDYPLLKSYNTQLEKMINFGWVVIRPFSIAFFHTLRFLYKYIGNYGWAIIIFSIFIKVALYPLTRKSFQSMKKMQELQPKMNALREKYKNNPQELNKKTMELYKEEGVNPMGGCLPMALQMPVLFALFNLFRTTIMLRQAEFLMIKDLSAPDLIIAGSVNLLPILLGISMIVQQRLQSTQNPQQKMMAYFMPIFLLFIFYRLSAGLNLYYFMFNALTIVQELIIKKNK